LVGKIGSDVLDLREIFAINVELSFASCAVHHCGNLMPLSGTDGANTRRGGRPTHAVSRFPGSACDRWFDNCSGKEQNRCVIASRLVSPNRLNIGGG
jgi:hypothetical protein